MTFTWFILFLFLHYLHCCQFPSAPAQLAGIAGGHVYLNPVPNESPESLLLISKEVKNTEEKVTIKCLHRPDSTPAQINKVLSKVNR